MLSVAKWRRPIRVPCLLSYFGTKPSYARNMPNGSSGQKQTFNARPPPSQTDWSWAVTSLELTGCGSNEADCQSSAGESSDQATASNFVRISSKNGSSTDFA